MTGQVPVPVRVSPHRSLRRRASRRCLPYSCHRGLPSASLSPALQRPLRFALAAATEPSGTCRRACRQLLTAPSPPPPSQPRAPLAPPPSSLPYPPPSASPCGAATFASLSGSTFKLSQPPRTRTHCRPSSSRRRCHRQPRRRAAATVCLTASVAALALGRRHLLKPRSLFRVRPKVRPCAPRRTGDKSSRHKGTAAYFACKTQTFLRGASPRTPPGLRPGP